MWHNIILHKMFDDVKYSLFSPTSDFVWNTTSSAFHVKISKIKRAEGYKSNKKQFLYLNKLFL